MRRDLDGDAAKKQASAGPARDEMKKKKEGDNARLMPVGNPRSFEIRDTQLTPRFLIEI